MLVLKFEPMAFYTRHLEHGVNKIENKQSISKIFMFYQCLKYIKIISNYYPIWNSLV